LSDAIVQRLERKENEQRMKEQVPHILCSGRVLRSCEFSATQALVEKRYSLSPAAPQFTESEIAMFPHLVDYLNSVPQESSTLIV
jgi:hypothetical protein